MQSVLDATEHDPRVNIRISDIPEALIHRAAVTRDYISQPRLSKGKTFVRLR